MDASWTRLLGFRVAAILFGAAVVVAVVGQGAGSAADEWSPTRLPFDKPRNISNGPNCTTHTGASAEAIDVPMDPGTPILAAQAGTVVWADRDPAQPSFGKLLKIRHSDGSVAWYAHLQEFAKQVGDQVINGEVVAYSGASGSEPTLPGTGAHLHFEVRDRNGNPVSIRGLPGITWIADDLCGSLGKLPGIAIGAPPSNGVDTLLWFELRVPGIGRQGTRMPISGDETKTVRVTLRDSDSNSRSFQATATYLRESGSYVGVATLDRNWPTDFYQVTLRLPNTLSKRAIGIPYVRNGSTTVLRGLMLKSGDANDDNVLHAFFDFQVMMGCYGVFRPPANCANDTVHRGSDLNDDGRVDIEDHDLFITMTGVFEGD
jgi:murein DD-endopeptidase MepM/ murein hydrolase activator NlpD